MFFKTLSTVQVDFSASDVLLYTLRMRVSGKPAPVIVIACISESEQISSLEVNICVCLCATNAHTHGLRPALVGTMLVNK